MKGAFLAADDASLFSRVRVLLVRLGAQVAGDGAVVQLVLDSGGLFTVFRDVPSLEWRSGTLMTPDGSRVPDLHRANACWIECRSESAFAALAHNIAQPLTSAAWVIDTDGVVWPASDVDPAHMKL